MRHASDVSDLTAIHSGGPRPSKPRTVTVTGAVKRAIEAMVWQGKPRRQAADIAGITDHALYSALRKPHVKAAYMAELDLLRTSEKARNIHRLVEIRDAADNMPAVNAIKVLEALSDQQLAQGQRQALPGLVVQINVASVTPSVPIEPAIVVDNE